MAEFEFRPVSADEMAEFLKVGSYVFANNDGPDNEPAALQPEWTHAAFHDGKIVATSGAFPFKMRWNGRSVQADGVTSVGTNPGFRRRGLVRQMIIDLLHRAHDNGQAVSILWASMGAIYQRFGYGLASTMTAYSFDPRLAEFQFGDRAQGYTRLLDREAAVPIMAKLYREFIEPRNLLLHRADIMWELPFQGPGANTYCAIHYDESDTPDGFLMYRTKHDPSLGPPGQRLTVQDFVYRDINAYRGLWEYIRAHDLVTKVDWEYAPQDDPAPTILLEPRVLESKTWDGIWLRVVDVAAALADRGYDHDGEATISIAEDPECAWNVGTYRLATRAGETTVERTNTAADIELSINALGSLLAGHQTLRHLTNTGRASVTAPSNLARFDALFSTRYRPAAMNEF